MNWESSVWAWPWNTYEYAAAGISSSRWSHRLVEALVVERTQLVGRTDEATRADRLARRERVVGPREDIEVAAGDDPGTRIIGLDRVDDRRQVGGLLGALEHAAVGRAAEVVGHAPRHR